jgi:hypothetical protein
LGRPYLRPRWLPEFSTRMSAVWDSRRKTPVPMSERVREPADLDPAVPDHRGEDIEADIDPARAPGHQPVCSRPPDPLLLQRMDCLDRGPVAIAASGLDLAEDHDPASPQDEVELAAGAPVVTVEDVVPAPPVRGGREILSGASEPGARVHGADARRWVRRKLALEPGRFRKHVPFRQLREFLDVEVAERDNLYL